VPGSAFSDQLNTAATEQKLYVLQPDLAARGFADVSLLDSIKQVDYKGFVDLVTEYDLVHSWF
jgi:tRNA 2-thiouridine synthesizing protein B